MEEKEGKGKSVLLMIALAVAATLLLALVVCIIQWRSIFTWSENTRKYDVYYYGVSEEQVYIYDVDTNVTGHLEIPETIEGMPVVYIGQGAFEMLPALTEVTIPDTVQVIGDQAFRSCRNLQKVMVGDDVYAMGNEVFADCESLEEIRFREDVREMGDRIFDLETRDEDTKVKALIPVEAPYLYYYLHQYEDCLDVVRVYGE